MSEIQKDWDFDKLVSLIENVQKNSILYDGFVAHSNMPLIQRIWANIAEQVGDGSTAINCKRRWQRLRNVYITAVRLGHRVQPIGIEQHLTFLKPFIKFRNKPPVESGPEDSLEYCTKLAQIVQEYPAIYFKNRTTKCFDYWQKVATRMGTGEVPEQCQLHWCKLRTRYSFHLKRGYIMKPLGIERHLAFLKPGVACPEPSAKRKRQEVESTRAKLRRDSAVAAALRHKHLRFDGKDEDALFLFEFLQDMAKMSDEEKMSFKLEAMRLAEQLRYEDKPCPWDE